MNNIDLILSTVDEYVKKNIKIENISEDHLKSIIDSSYKNYIHNAIVRSIDEFLSKRIKEIASEFIDEFMKDEENILLMKLNIKRRLLKSLGKSINKYG